MYDTPQWTFKTWAADRISFRLFGFTVLCWTFRLRDLHHIFIGLYLRVLSDNIIHQRMKDRKTGDGYNGCKIYLKFESKIKCTLYLQERNMAFKIQTILWLKQFLKCYSWCISKKFHLKQSVYQNAAFTANRSLPCITGSLPYLPQCQSLHRLSLRPCRRGSSSFSADHEGQQQLQQPHQQWTSRPVCGS